ncbi:E1-E2 ATPase-domain-containing protein [Glomus cerebriforme]|uniref:P-type Cu(+) transporter n=1 Tax=Glomus cerebriforme TaxID=658196 RepID=A0A397SYH3_9GLOM|nr:E1-E2 ATPase-domain-containing protein [Glomus cerebriforme]
MDEKISKANFSLSGLTCASCVRSIENSLKKLPGLIPTSIKVNLLMSNATLEFDENKINVEQIKQTIIDSGYNVEDTKVEKKYDLLPTKPQKAITNNNEHDIDILSQEGVSPIHATNTILIVSGMTCASCINTIQYTLESLPGVEYARVNLLTGEANIKHDINKVGPRDLIKAVEDSGYGAELHKKNKSDNNGNSIRRRAEKYQKLLRNRFLTALYFSIPTALVSMIFMMLLPHDNPVHMAMSHQIIPGLEVGTLILFILATPVQFILGYPFYVKGIRSVWYSHQANMDTLVAIGTTVAYFGSILNVIIPIINKENKPGYQFFETSVFLITFIWLGRWLEAKVKGKTFETITKLMELQPEKATLITLSYDDNKQENIVEKEIDLDLIQVGDILKVNPGAKVPCDGKIFRGATSLDESMLTGESIPVTKRVDDEVISATVNLSSMIWIKATRVGSDTTLSRIIELVQAAQSSKKAPIEELADKIAQVFVPVVILIAILDYIIWVSLGASGKIPENWLSNNESYQIFSLFFAISVMVIACPCAMGLASPTAIMVGTGLAARFGILIKGGGEAIEMTFRLDTIAFDKTGTLTYGKPKVVGAKVFGSPSHGKEIHKLLFQIIGTVESSSDHPLAKAVTKYISKKYSETTSNNIIMESVSEIPGKGLQAVVKVNDPRGHNLLPNKNSSTYNIFIGNEKWLRENDCIYPINDENKTNSSIKKWKRTGCSVVLVGLSNDSSGGYILAQIGIADTPRPDAAKTVSELTARGIEVWMITGDNPITAEAIAKKIGIKNILAEVTPEMKAEKIKWLQRKGRPIKESNKFLQLFRGRFHQNMDVQLTRRAIVAMIGDGINDSPALAQSDLPISVASATDVAIESASIILTRSTLSSLITLIELSRAIIWRIRYNFLWAYIYNSLAIPIAAGVFFPISKFSLRPEVASLSMAVSSISVLLSSLWLKKFKEPKY